MNPGICLAIIAICAAQINTIAGLKCYACVQSGIDGDRRCERDPKAIQNSAINCNKKYCVIRRIEYVDRPGTVFSFYRGCEQRPDYINSEITDTQFKTYYRACTTDICNDGNGITGGGGGGGLNPDGNNDNQPILVPGVGNFATSLGPSIVVMASSLFLVARQIYA